MLGKDQLVAERSQALDVAKGIIVSLNQNSEAAQRERIQQLMETIPRPVSEHVNGSLPRAEHVNGSLPRAEHVSGSLPRAELANGSLPRMASTAHHDIGTVPLAMQNVQWPGRTRSFSPSSASSSEVHEELPRAKSAVSWRHRQKGYEIDVNLNPYLLESDQHKGKITSDSHTSMKNRPQTAVVRPTIQSSLHGDHNSKSVRQTKQRGRHYRSSAGGGGSRLPGNSESDMNSSQELSDAAHKPNVIRRPPEPTSEDEEDILTLLVSVGDRVMLNIPEKTEKYGKRKISHPRYLSGIVKFKGQLDHGQFDPKVYVGIRLDDEAGDTDGTYKGKRYMYTPEDHGKFVKLKELRSILDIQTGQYKTFNLLVKKHLLRNPVQECHSIGTNSITSTA